MGGAEEVRADDAVCKGSKLRALGQAQLEDIQGMPLNANWHSLHSTYSLVLAVHLTPQPTWA